LQRSRALDAVERDRNILGWQQETLLAHDAIAHHIRGATTLAASHAAHALHTEIRQALRVPNTQANRTSAALD
jgi:hypothetical protein